jgi:type IX secretion system PorP/SprF family membrane protein
MKYPNAGGQILKNYVNRLIILETILNRISYFCRIFLPLFKGKSIFMQKKISFFILLLLVKLAALAQQDPLYTNYMLAKTITNPAFVGAGEDVNALFTNRIMFAGFGEGKPETSVFGIEAPVEIFGSKSGLGVMVKSDAIGYQEQTDVELTYSYHATLETGRLGIGLNGGFYNYHIAGEWYTPEETEFTPTYPMKSNDSATPGESSSMTFGIGFGVYYETQKYYLGFAANHLNQAELRTDDALQKPYSYYTANYYLSGGYNIELPNPLYDLRPSFLLRSDLAAYSLDLNGLMYYKSKYWAGLGLRVTTRNISAVTILGGLELMNGLNVGYAFDLNTTAMIGNGATSHEVLVTYSFNLKTKRDQKYKSVRYL